MANYKLELTKSAAKAIAKTKPKKARRKLVDRIGTLADEPRPDGAQAVGETHRWAVGDHAVEYTVDGKHVVVRGLGEA